jgi:hypothetical protein
MPATRWRWALATATLLGVVATRPVAAQPDNPSPRVVSPQPRISVWNPTYDSPYARTGFVRVSAAPAPPDQAPETLPPPQIMGTPNPSRMPAIVVLPESPGPGTEPEAAPAPGTAPVAAGKGSFWARCKYALQKCMFGFPEEFEARPLGESVYRHYDTHVANGEAARMVLYQYDFVPGGEGLNYRGLDRVAQIQALLPRNAFPVVIERTPDCPPLAEARRVAVLNALGHGPFPIPPERVLVGPPIALGLQGVEAEVIYRNQINVIRSYGVLPGGAGTTQGIGAATTSGLASPAPQR